MSYHRRLFPHSRAKPALETDLADASAANPYSDDDHDDFVELCERVNKVRKILIWAPATISPKVFQIIYFLQVLPRLQSFAPWHYWLKAFFLLRRAIRN